MILLAMLLGTIQIAVGREPGAPQARFKPWQASCEGHPGTIHPNGGGFVALTASVSATVYVAKGASICDRATVSGQARILNYAKIFGNAHVSDDATVSGYAIVQENASVSGHATVSGQTWIYGEAKVSGNATVLEKARLMQNATITGHANVVGTAQIYGYAKIDGNAQVSGDAHVLGNAIVAGIATISDHAVIRSFDKICKGNTPNDANSALCNKKKQSSSLPSKISDPSITSNSDLPCGGQPGHRRKDKGFISNTATVHFRADIAPDAAVCDYAVVGEFGKVYDHAIVSGHAQIDGVIYGSAKVSDYAVVSQLGRVGDDATVSGYAKITQGHVYGSANITDYAWLYRNAEVCSGTVDYEVTSSLCYPERITEDSSLPPSNVSDGARDNSAPSYEPQSINTRKNNNAGISR